MFDRDIYMLFKSPLTHCLRVSDIVCLNVYHFNALKLIHGKNVIVKHLNKYFIHVYHSYWHCQSLQFGVVTIYRISS